MSLIAFIRQGHMQLIQKLRKRGNRPILTSSRKAELASTRFVGMGVRWILKTSSRALLEGKAAACEELRGHSRRRSSREEAVWRGAGRHAKRRAIAGRRAHTRRHVHTQREVWWKSSSHRSANSVRYTGRGRWRTILHDWVLRRTLTWHHETRRRAPHVQGVIDRQRRDTQV